MRLTEKLKVTCESEKIRAKVIEKLVDYLIYLGGFEIFLGFRNLSLQTKEEDFDGLEKRINNLFR